MINSTIIKNKIKGPIFSIITPFTKSEKIDYNKLKQYIKFLYSRGARVFYVMFYNSRFGLMDEKEILKINIFCIKEVKRLSKENIVICAEPYHCSTKKSTEYVNFYKKKGADIVSLIFGEKYYSEEQVFDHFKRIHDQTKCFLLLHQQVLENGKTSNPPFIFYPIKLLKRISKLKRFIAMKEDGKKDDFTKKICKNISKDMIIITSGEGKKQWMKANKYGCQSWLSGISNIDPKIAIDFYNFYKKKNIKMCLKIITKLEDIFFQLKNKYGWHLAIKASLELNNNFPRFERSPLKEINSTELKFAKKIFLILKKNSIFYFNSKYIVKK